MLIETLFYREHSLSYLFRNHGKLYLYMQMGIGVITSETAIIF